MNKNGIKELKDFYVTSDTWFGRNQILEIANRGSFKNVEAMNQHIINKWNGCVSKDDTVFHLGNFAWDPNTARRILKKLNGKIYFLVGSADEALLEVYEDFKNVSIIEDQIVLLPLHDVILSHYPLLMWAGKESGTLHVHGHAVFNHPTDLTVERRVNICTDQWGMKPIKISTLKDFINEEI
jgi:calcineurin-like phosphoesterase family protein